MPQPKLTNESTGHPRIVGINDAAAYSGIAPWTLRELIWRGELPVVKLPDGRGGNLRRTLLAVADLDALIERSREREQT